MTNTNAMMPPVSDSYHSDSDAIIFAPASAPGQAGVAVYRISGTDITPALHALGIAKTLQPRHATLCRLVDQHSGAMIDQALAIYFPAPHSFTGEAVLELHTHGGLAIRRSITDCLSALPGCRLAEPGEFSKRAFLNNKMDLLQAEAVADLIAAETAAQQQLALSQLDGAMSEQFEKLRHDTLHALALMEAYIDFPDEEIPEATLKQAEGLIASLISQMTQLLEDAPSGEMIREGVRIAIIGPPNAGKSSLLNALARRDIAIVSDIAGTTRDRIEVHLNINGYFAKVTDTAGLRSSEDQIELEGIRRTESAAAEADIILGVFDIVSYPELNEHAMSLLDKQSAIVLNKCDLSDRNTPSQINGHPVIAVSALTSDGVEGLIHNLSEMIETKIASCPSPILTRARHRTALSEALAMLEQFDVHKPLELSTEELRRAAMSIGKITGKIEVDQVLGVIFSEFCIGK